jgi:hypothetical protein
VLLGRAQLRALQAIARPRVVGIQAQGFRVLDNGVVVVLAEFGVAPAPARGRSGAAGSGKRQQKSRDREGRLSVRLVDDIDTTGNVERKLLIGRIDIFLQIYERNRRLAALLVDGHQRAQAERLLVYDEHEPLIVGLCNLGHHFERVGVCRRAFRRIDQRRGEVPDEVSLARENRIDAPA